MVDEIYLHIYKCNNQVCYREGAYSSPRIQWVDNLKFGEGVLAPHELLLGDQTARGIKLNST